MAAIVDPLIGNIFKLRINTNFTTPSWKTVAALTNLQLDLNSSERSIGSFDTCGWEANAPGLKNSSVSATAWVNYNPITNVLKTNDLFDLFNNNTKFQFKIIPVDCEGNILTDEYMYSGEGYVGAMPFTFPNEDTASIDLELRTGQITQAKAA